MMGWSPQCHIPSFGVIGPLVPENFTIYVRGGHFWSCDSDGTNKRLFPLPKEAPHKIWL